MEVMNQKKAISDFVDKNRMKMNPVLFERNDGEIIQELKNVILSCQRDGANFMIRVDSFEVIDEYDKINQILAEYYNYQYRNKSKAKRKDNQYEYINLNESDIRLLIVNYYLEAKNEQIKPDDKPPVEDPNHLRVIIIIPRIIDRYYFRINGIMRSTLYQIVDGSTYNNATSNAKIPSVTLKIIFMAVRVFRDYVDIQTVDGETLKANHYMSRIFNKTISGMLYFLARYGYYGALDFLGITGVHITNYNPNSNDMYTIQIGNDKFINVVKYLFDNDLVVKSFIACLYKSIIPDMPYEKIFDPEYWVKNLGSEFSGIVDKKAPKRQGKDTKEARTYGIYDSTDPSLPNILEKGYSILDSFYSIYDISTHADIRLPESDKADMFCIFRWMLREFNNLRMKDNLDISVKKIRFAGYISSLYAMKIARGIYRVADQNRKVTTDSIKKAIRTDPNFLLNSISRCGMVSYRNMVSDMDSMVALKFTYKGISGLGESNGQSIPNIYRTIHPSHIGRVDLDSSSDGNPGITGTICPFTDIHDGFFSDYQEPNGWESEFMKTVEAYKRITGIQEALEFQENVLGKDLSEQLEVTGEIIAAMQQIIKPHIYADQGEVITLREVQDE